ncbi:VanZ family protein [Winogradskyella maritima]|uniref:VanZ family protein n=1 Tax=Winogradskyella maritima TaxID=1517766 RepID=A0ABV8AE03_9FLAO|nr:VanZ family protein [Winogradskyella maritima]
MAKNQNLWLILAIICTGLVLYLSLNDPPVSEEDINIPHFDKFAHVIMYLGFTFTWSMALAKLKLNAFFVIALVWAVAFSTILEIFQEQLNPNRHFDVYDIIANIIGVILGIIVAKYYMKIER